MRYAHSPWLQIASNHEFGWTSNCFAEQQSEDCEYWSRVRNENTKLSSPRKGNNFSAPDARLSDRCTQVKSRTHQMKSVQWLQNVGCLKNLAVNLWFLTSCTFFCRRAPLRANRFATTIESLWIWSAISKKCCPPFPQRVTSKVSSQVFSPQTNTENLPPVRESEGYCQPQWISTKRSELLAFKVTSMDFVPSTVKKNCARAVSSSCKPSRQLRHHVDKNYTNTKYRTCVTVGGGLVVSLFSYIICVTRRQQLNITNMYSMNSSLHTGFALHILKFDMFCNTILLHVQYS